MTKNAFSKEDLEVIPFDISQHLDDEDMIAGYLSLCLEDENPNVFLNALGDVAKARGMTELARATGLSRESLYKTFAAGKKPQLETILKIARAYGLRVRFERNAEAAELDSPPKRPRQASRSRKREPIPV